MTKQADLHTDATTIGTDGTARVEAHDTPADAQPRPDTSSGAVTNGILPQREPLAVTPTQDADQEPIGQKPEASDEHGAMPPRQRHFSEVLPTENLPHAADGLSGTPEPDTDGPDESREPGAASTGDDLALANENLKRRLAEQQRELDGLRKMLEVAADVIQAVPAGLFLFQYQPPGELFFLNCNPEATRLTGLGHEDCRGVELDEIWPNARGQGLIDAFLNAARSGKPFEAEKVLYRNSRIERILRVKAFAIPGERLGVAFLEVTDQFQSEGVLRKVEEEIGARVEQSTSQLISRNQTLEDECANLKQSWDVAIALCRVTAQEELAGRLARVLSNPLENVQEAVERALARLDSGYMSLMRPALDQILREARQLAVLVKYLKQCSGMPPSGGLAQSSTLDVSEVVRASVEALSADRDLADTNDSTPPFRELVLGDNCRVLGAPVEIRDVVDMLLTHSLTTTDMRSSISVTTRAETDSVVLEVSHTSQGVPENDVPLLLEPLGLSKPDRPDLGLAAVAGVIRRYGGDVRVAAEPGQGMTVTIRLPRAKDS